MTHCPLDFVRLAFHSTLQVHTHSAPQLPPLFVCRAELVNGGSSLCTLWRATLEGSLSHLLSSLYTSSPSSRNIMKLLHLVLLLAPLSCSHFVPASHQAALVDLDHHAEREKVPGDNPAYYSREKAADQLFEILEFTVSPNPPIV